MLFQLLKLPFLLIGAVFSLITAIFPTVLWLFVSALSLIGTILPVVFSLTAKLISILIAVGLTAFSLFGSILSCLLTILLILVAVLVAVNVIAINWDRISSIATSVRQGVTDLILDFKLALGLIQKENPDYSYYIEQFVSAAKRGRIKTVKSLIAAGLDVDTPELALCLVRMLNNCSEKNLRKESFGLFTVMSDEQLNLFIRCSKILYPAIKLAEEYRLDKLKESLFESVWATVKTMRQLDASLADPKVIRDQILPMLQPKWFYNNKDYKKLSAEVFKKTLRALNNIDEKTSKAKQKPQKPDITAVLVPSAAEPVVFRVNPRSESAVAKNDVIIDVLPLEKTNKGGLNHGF